MNRVMFRGAMVWDGSGAEAYPADVLVEGKRIRTIARTLGQLSAEGATVIDGRGKTLLPGLVEGHAHISFGGAVNDKDLGDIPARGACPPHHAQRQDAARSWLHQRL